MKPEIFSYICSAINAAKIIGSEAMIFNENGAFACDEAISVMMIQPHNTSFEFAALAMTDIIGFGARVALFPDSPNVTEIIDKASGAVRTVTMKAGRTKVDYQCCLPAMVQVPKKVNDEFIAEVQLDEESVSVIQRALGVMRGEYLYVVNNDGEVTIEITAINNDTFNHTLPNAMEYLDDEVGFIYKYPAKKLMPLLRKNPTGTLKFGKRGTVNIEVDGFNFYLLQIQ